MGDAKPAREGLWKRTYREFVEDDCMAKGAAVAYYAVFSLPGLLVIVVTVAGWIWGPQAVKGQLQQQISGVLGEGGAQQIQTMIERAGQPQQGGWIAMLVGAVVLVFGATGVLAQLQATLNQLWEVEPDPEQAGAMSFIWKRLLALGMILLVAALILVSLVMTSIAMTAAQRVFGGLSSTVVQGITAGVSLVIFTLLFAALFKWLPDARVTWSEVLLGAFLTAVLFMIGKYLMGLYFGSRNPGATYGAAGSLVLIMLWIYYSALIFFVGAELTQVWARRHGREIEPAEGAVRVVQERRRVGTDRPRQAAS